MGRRERFVRGAVRMPSLALVYRVIAVDGRYWTGT